MSKSSTLATTLWGLSLLRRMFENQSLIPFFTLNPWSFHELIFCIDATISKMQEMCSNVNAIVYHFRLRHERGGGRQTNTIRDWQTRIKMLLYKDQKVGNAYYRTRIRKLLSRVIVTAMSLISAELLTNKLSIPEKKKQFLNQVLHTIHHHPHVVLVARISLTLSRYFSLSFIVSGRSSGQHPVSSHSCWMYVRAGRPAFVRPYVEIYKSTSLMSSSLLLQQCPACLVRLTWIAFVIGGRWPYSWCLVGCCRQDLFKIARSILV